MYCEDMLAVLSDLDLLYRMHIFDHLEYPKKCCVILFLLPNLSLSLKDNITNVKHQIQFIVIAL